MLENSLFEATWLMLIFSFPLSASRQEDTHDTKDEEGKACFLPSEGRTQVEYWQ